MKNVFKFLALIPFIGLLCGCGAAVVAGAGAAGGYAVAKDKGPVGSYVDDSVITTKVKANHPGISVSTNKGVVSLTGTVNTYAERQKIIADVQQTKGVKGVVASNLTVKRHYRHYKKHTVKHVRPAHPSMEPANQTTTTQTTTTETTQTNNQ